MKDSNDNILGFDVDAEIILIIKAHRANVATMAREIVDLRAEIAKKDVDIELLKKLVSAAIYRGKP
jgi:hypothetical protein